MGRGPGPVLDLALEYVITSPGHYTDRRTKKPFFSKQVFPDNGSITKKRKKRKEKSCKNGVFMHSERAGK